MDTDRCPRCLESTPTDVVCPTCRQGHHHECWIAGGGCGDDACPSHVEGSDTPPLGLPIPDEDPDEPVVIEKGRAWRWVALGAGVVAVLLGALFAWQALSPEEATVATTTVPQVTDFQWQEAREILAEQGFEVRWDSEVRADGVHEAVIRQVPEAGAAVPEASTVYITYSVVPEPTPTPAVTPTGPTATPTADASPGATAGPTPGPSASPAPAQVGTPLDPPWVAIVATPADEQIARDLYDGRFAAEHPDGGVLSTTDYPDMADGFWVVYLDTFASRAEAEAFCTERYGRPPPGSDPACYVRTTDGVR